MSSEFYLQGSAAGFKHCFLQCLFLLPVGGVFCFDGQDAGYVLPSNGIIYRFLSLLGISSGKWLIVHSVYVH